MYIKRKMHTQIAWDNVEVDNLTEYFNNGYGIQ